MLAGPDDGLLRWLAEEESHREASLLGLIFGSCHHDEEAPVFDRRVRAAGSEGHSRKASWNSGSRRKAWAKAPPRLLGQCGRAIPVALRAQT